MQALISPAACPFGGPRRSALRARWIVLVALLLLPVISGCTTVRYLVQASAGQISLRTRARDIDEVKRDIRTELWVRDLLSKVASIKRFGERQGLKPTANYTQYTELRRAYVVWVVSASEPLRFHDETWTFPIVGSVPYLGWFHEADAERFAEGLRKEGWDVDVRGAEAYSTLGWFKDPVLSTMLREDRAALGNLANVILHESLHATIYLGDQTDLNESLASFVADRLTLSYLDEEVGALSPEKAAYVAAAADGERRVARLLEARHALEVLYASAKPAREKLREKGSLLSSLTAELGWRRPINNATLSQFKVYNSGAAELSLLIEACGGSFPRFIGALWTLRSDLFSGHRQTDLGKVIVPLLRAGCPGGPGRPGP